jgi:hypothetical protein
MKQVILRSAVVAHFLDSAGQASFGVLKGDGYVEKVDLGIGVGCDECVAKPGHGARAR